MKEILKGWLDPKVLVAIYAAILSTVNLILNLLTKKRKLEIKIFVKQDIKPPIQIGLEPATQNPMLYIQITNKSKTNTYIKDVVLIIGKEKIEYKDNSKRIVFPYELKHGELLECKLNLFKFTKTLDNTNSNYDLKLSVIDTLGKIFKSNKIKKEIILKELNIAREECKKIEKNFYNAKH